MVLLVPLLLAGALGALRVAGELDRADALDRFVRQAGMARQVTAVLHELQRERTLVALVAASGADGDRLRVDEQLRRVDAELAALRAHRSGAALAPAPDAAYRNATEALTDLASSRDEALGGAVPAEVVVIDYTSAVIALRGLRRSLLAGAPPPLPQRAEAVLALGAAAEQVSRQHAILLSGLQAGDLSPSQHAALRATQARLDAAVSEFSAAVGPQQRSGGAALRGPAADERARLVGLALRRLDAGEEPGIVAREWDVAAGASGALIRRAESALSGRLRADAAALAAGLRADAVRDSVVLAVLSALVVVLLALVVRSLLRPLRVLRTATFDVADRRLPEVFDRVRAGRGPPPELPVDPIPVYGRAEVGHLARAVDAVHTEAVRLAAEQSAARSSADEVLVNLSRRSHELVERQLELIDELQRDDRDPELLSHAFALDQLAVRMRRTSDKLLVLAGVEPPVRTGYPVDLLDALRAAASEVEDHHHVVVRGPPELTIAGAVATDLVHLVAELLDNATGFSRPDTEVVVSATATEQGGLLVEIIDSGRGMSAGKLRGTNEQLASPSVPDTAPGRRTGLFVVGRLARRHGLVVRLRSRHRSPGLTAVVEVPARHVVRGATSAGTAAAVGTGRRGWEPDPPAADTSAGDTTAAGLPRRTPRTRLVPGAASPDTAGGGPPARSAEAVHEWLSRYQDGLREGRHAWRGSDEDESSETGEGER